MPMYVWLQISWPNKSFLGLSNCVVWENSRFRVVLCIELGTLYFRYVGRNDEIFLHLKIEVHFFYCIGKWKYTGHV